MRRVASIAMIGAAIAAAALSAQTPAAQNSSGPIEFDVASIKAHPPDGSGQFFSSMRTLPTGQIVMSNVSLRTIISRAYPSRGSQQVLGLPAWAEGLYYDVNVKANRTVSRDEQLEMWRVLLRDRMKLAAHYEPREEASFDLVFARADHRLGPQMKPSTCTPPAPGATPPPGPAGGPPPRRTGAEVMASCNGMMSTGNNTYAPHITAAGLATLLRSGAGRQVIDKTGLGGFFDVEFTYAAPRPPSVDAAAAAEPTDAPEFFTAVQDQLGFKLVPSTTQVEVLVIDHVERPTEN